MYENSVNDIQNDGKDMKQSIKSLFKWVCPKFYRDIQIYNYKRRALPAPFTLNLKQLNKNHTVIDLGANRGWVTECLARSGAHVFAFEPNSDAFVDLKKVASRYTNVTAIQKAAGTKNRTIKLFHHTETGRSNEDHTQSSSLLKDKKNVSLDHFEKVVEIDFAKFIRDLNCQIEILKIDIEGFEVELINHLLDQNVLNVVRKIYLETHEKKIPDLYEKTQKLKNRIKRNSLEEKFFYEWH